MPEFDREGGSRRLFHFLEFFQQAGWAVSFAAENPNDGERYARVLQQMGIATYSLRDRSSDNTDALLNFERLVATGGFDLVLFAFWYFAEAYIPLVRALSLTTTVVVDSVDVQFLRQSRRVFCDPQQTGRPHVLDKDYAREMMREVNVYATADAVLTVSQKEADLINDFVGKTVAFAVPDMEDADASTVPFGGRNGMVFVGNFRHPPNVQAVEYLCRDILPKVPTEILARHPLYIVGNDPNETVLNCCTGVDNVRLVGWVPSVLPYLQRSRLSLIPLLYGAGTKRKLMQSMMVGTPCVSTPIGIEGLNLQHDRHVLVAEDAAAFAASITRLITDGQLWQRLAREGQDFVMAVHGREAVFARFGSVIDEIIHKLSRSPILWDEWTADLSLFDYELDKVTTRDALQQGKLRGVCNVSGSDTEFIIYSDNLREDIVATASASINRHRQLICGLSMAVFGHPNGSLAGIAGHINQNNLRVYIAETNSVLSDFLRQNLKPHLFVCSEYFGSSYKSGDMVDGMLHQDLQRTSFDDETFDIVITSEVFEHIPDAISAEIEVMRILKRGGVYCFTVPFLPASEHDLVLARMDEKGTVEHLAEPQFHDDRLRPDEGILVYRLFSFNDLKERFGAMGHEFKSTRFWSKSLGILGSACWTHTVRKNKNALNAS